MTTVALVVLALLLVAGWAWASERLIDAVARELGLGGEGEESTAEAPRRGSFD